MKHISLVYSPLVTASYMNLTPMHGNWETFPASRRENGMVSTQDLYESARDAATKHHRPVAHTTEIHLPTVLEPASP